MSSTEISTLVGLGTFFVITITAIAAVIQLRHLRRANELEGLLSVVARIDSMDFQTCVDETRRLVADRMPDPEYRRSLLDGTFERANNPWLQLGNAYEWLGTLVRWQLIPERALMDMYAPNIIAAWKSMEPIIVVIRRKPKNAALMENFEFLYVRSRQSLDQTPSRYPADTPRAELRDEWAEADGA